jgi:Xaa-Pro aminopeptidase
MTKEKKCLISNKTSWALEQALGPDRCIESRSIIAEFKAVKSESEREGMRQCHIRDGAALCSYFAWLEHELIAKKAKLDEVDAASKLEELRSKNEHFKGLSFPTISSTGANAAVIHYQPEKGSCEIIDANEIYLCDSGAQYLDGTTDVTRTLHFKTPTKEQKQAYTNVLKGHIALSRIVFPKGTTGFVLDTLARQFLWADGKDYRHGTGHGVGSYLNVHEGPIGIGTRIAFHDVALAEGNVISNEPGYYEDGKYGIRIENLVMVKTVHDKGFGDKPYFGFEHLTMAPMAKSLVDVDLLSIVEKEWLNAYHLEVFEKLSPLYSKDDDLALAWLKRETEPVPVK